MGESMASAGKLKSAVYHSCLITAVFGISKHTGAALVANCFCMQAGCDSRESRMSIGNSNHIAHETCRSFLPPRAKFGDPRLNSNLRFPQIACIISPHPWFSFFYKVSTCLHHRQQRMHLQPEHQLLIEIAALEFEPAAACMLILCCTATSA